MTRVALGLAHHADHARPPPGGDLRGGLPDLAVETHHQHGLAGLRQAGTFEAFDGRHEGHADAGCLGGGYALGLRHAGVGLDHEVGGVRAIAANA